MEFRTSFVRVGGWLALLLVLALSDAAAQGTSGAIRGLVSSSTGQPIELVEIVATNTRTGVRFNATTDAEGRYRFPSLPVGAYNVVARRIGYQATERRDVVVRLGETVLANFALSSAPTTLEDVVVVAEATPLIDPDQTGKVDLISAEQISAIPVNGRNFADLVALSPSVGVDVGDGTGGALSLAGGRRGANLIQIDGAGATGTFFGGEARGSDRIPFAFSIETVQEFQVVSSGFDVEYGFFSGGVINAVTKSGTNELHGSVFGYFRDDALTRNDFLGRTPDFTSRQLGGTISGPIIRDKVHFFLAVERQDRDEPVFGLPAPGSTPDALTRVHPDSVARFLDILDRIYGVEDQAGEFTQNQDEWSIFGRIDWQISNRHRLTLRHNFTDLEQRGDRISSDETVLNGGVFSNTGNSTVAQLTSTFSANVWNEARVQVAFEPRPREANTLLPEGEVFVTSDFGGGVTASLRGLECCNDPVLPNNLEETTVEIVNNLHIRTGDHTFKVGGHFNYFDYLNFFFFRQQGRFRYNSLADFEARNPFRFERALPNPGPDGLFYTDDDFAPLAQYSTLELGVYAQDAWRATDRLTLTGGVRADFTSLPDAAPLNDQFLTDLGLRTDEKPSDVNISPRLGFAYDFHGDGRAIVRGGAGLFFGRFPSVLYSNSLLNQGENQLSLRCDGVDVPVPDYDQYRNDLNTIPTQCAGGGAAAPPIPNVNVFAPDFEYPRTWKASLGYDRSLTSNLKVNVGFLYSTTDQNFYVEDRNLLAEQFRSGIENRPVFAPVAEISTSSGEPGFGDNRRVGSFNDALVHVSTAESRTYQVTVGVEQRGDVFTWQAGYTFTHSRDNASYSCCISGTANFETPTAGDPNNIGEPGDDLNGTWGPSDFSRPHNIVVSGIMRLPADITVSGIWRTQSGRPWTPIVDGNVNGDREGSNDRVFVGRNLNFDDPATDLPLLDGFLADYDCLAEQEGRVVSRNSCRNKMYTQLDLRLQKAIPTVGGQRIEIIVDLFNVLNLINDDWSRNVGVSQFGSARELLELEGFDPATQTHIYAVNPSFGTESDLTGSRTDQGTLQIGVKYTW